VCHKTEYYSISLKEIKDTLAAYIENKDILRRHDGKLSFDKNFLCNECHQLNKIIFRDSFSAKLPDKTWNEDIMCQTCHINYISEEK
ncbi:MAG: hypothetical protein ACFFAO_20030, partial [Candidatus Hermodarchaeota archaeon]